MTSIASITPQNAPRDNAGLFKMGIFQLRLLIEKLGGLKETPEKLAFAKMSTEEKITLAQQLLANWDKLNGGGNGVTNGVAPGMGAMPAPQQQQMMSPMDQQQMMMQGQGQPQQMMGTPTQVDPAALANAQQAAQAASPPAATSRRSPRTQQAPAAPEADLGGAIVELMNRISEQTEAGNQALTAGLREMGGQLSELQKGAAKLNHLEQCYSGVYKTLQSMDAAISQQERTNRLLIALLLPLAEQVLGASREEVLQASLGDVDSVAQIIQQVTNPGKG